MEFLEDLSRIYIAELSNYLLFAVIGFVLFYVILKKKWAHKKIQKRIPKNQDYYREIGYSLVTLIIFALVGYTIVNTSVSQHTQLYFDIRAMPMWWYYLTFPLMFVIHDTYFYWMHRAIHHPSLFRHVHLIHHKSTNPSPWAAYAFHPWEAVLEAAIFPIFVFIMPVHISAVGLFFLFQIGYNVYGHLGYELYPKGFNQHWLGKWINTSVHHNLHHKHFDNGYGLYFTFWDRMMGTMAPHYDESFDDVKNRIPE